MNLIKEILTMLKDMDDEKVKLVYEFVLHLK